MFQIGEFSRIASVTIETLRHYDAIGLLKPAKVAPTTGYRYYTAGQLLTLNQILTLKDVGLSLEEIARILQNDLSTDELRGMLKAQLAITENTIAEAQLRRERIQARLQQLNVSSTPSKYEVNLKSTEMLVVAGIRETIATPAEIPQRWNTLFSMIAEWIHKNRLPIGFPLAIYHDESYTGEHIDTECAFVILNMQIEDIPTPNAPIFIRQIDALPQVASLTVENFQQQVGGLKSAYEAIGQWIANNGYHVSGAPRELYSGSPANNFTAEVQFPVEKADSEG